MKLQFGKDSIVGCVLFLYSIFLALLSESVAYLTMCYLSILDIALVAVYVASKRIKFYDSRFIFLLIVILYTISQNLVYPLVAGSREYYYSVLYTLHHYSDERMQIASLCTLLCINTLAIVLFFGRRTLKASPLARAAEEEAENPITLPDERRLRIIRVMAAVLFCLSAPLMLYKMFVYVRLFLRTGYGESAKSLLPSVVISASPFFFTAVILGTTVNLAQKRKNVFYDVAIVVYVAYSMLIGDRGGGICFALFRIWEGITFRSGARKMRFSFKWVALIAAGIVLFFAAMQFVRTYRNAYSHDFFEVIRLSFQELTRSNFILKDLLEFGGSMYPLNETIGKMSAEGEPFAYGAQYLDFFINMLPSTFGVNSLYPHLAKWLTGSTEFAGHGFSIIAEGYYNFGEFAWIAMVPIGLVVRKVYYWDEGRRDSFYKIMVTALCMCFMGDIARRSIAQFGFTCLWYIILPVLVAKRFSFSYEPKTLRNESGEKRQTVRVRAERSRV